MFLAHGNEENLRSKGNFVDKSIPYSSKYFEKCLSFNGGNERPEETECKSIKLGLSV
jgi:hypothetical protein